MKIKVIRYTVVALLGIICLIMAITIGKQFKKDLPEDKPIPAQTEVPANPPVIFPDAKDSEVSAAAKPKVIINPVKKDTEDEIQAVYRGTNQTIQPDSEKPDPTAEQLADGSQTPDGEAVITLPPEELTDPDKKPLDTVAPASEIKKENPSEPQGGDKEDGLIFVPGFGWILDNGGGGQGESAGSDGDINKMVGDM